MSLSAEQLQALDALPPPASLDRIVRFLSDLGEQGNAPLGESGRSAQVFAASLAGGAPSFSARQVSGWAAILMDRYQIKLGEIQEFALWFVQRQEILTETPEQVVLDPPPAPSAAPDMVLANPPAPPVVVTSGAAPFLTSSLPLAVAPPAALPEDAEAEAAPTAPTEDRPRRLQKARTGSTPRDRRIERRPSAVEATDAPRSEGTLGETPEGDDPPPRKSFRLTPRMITRPAFVTNVGLAGMMAGLSLGAAPASALDGPAMMLAVPPMPGMAVPPMPGMAVPPMPGMAVPPMPGMAVPPMPGMGAIPGTLPTYGPLGPFSASGSPLLGLAGASTPPVTAAPAFMPLVTPMALAASPPSAVRLGMPAVQAAPLTAAPFTPAPVMGPAAAPIQTTSLALSSPSVTGLSSPGTASQTLDTLPGVPADTLVGALPPPSNPPASPPLDLARQQPVGSAAPLPLATPAPPAPSGGPDPTWAGQSGRASSAPALGGLASAGTSSAGTSSASFSTRPSLPGQPKSAVPAGTPAWTSPPGATWDSRSGGWKPAVPSLTGLVAGSAALALAGRLLPPAQAYSGVPEAPGRFSTTPAFGASLRPQALFGAGLKAAVPSDQAAPPGALPASPAASLLTITPEMGQMTLQAPPLQIASAQAERGGAAAAVDWQTLAGGAGALDEGGLMRLKGVLPAQAGILYPALPPGSLGAGMVNLPLAGPLVHSLLRKGYGSIPLSAATRAADLGGAVKGGRPPAAPLRASLVPTAKRPTGAAPGLLGQPDENAGGAGALAEAGRGQSARGGVLDFLGLPVRLAPSLGGRSDLARETTARNAGLGPVRPQRVLRPEQFAPLRSRVFPAFQSMAVEPDRAAWRKAAPALGLRDAGLTTMLAPDARVPVQTLTGPQAPAGPQPAARSRPSASASLPGSLAASRLLSGHQAPGSTPGLGRPHGGGHAASTTPRLIGQHPTPPGSLFHRVSEAGPHVPASTRPASPGLHPLSPDFVTPGLLSEHLPSGSPASIRPLSAARSRVLPEALGSAGGTTFSKPHSAAAASHQPLGSRHSPWAPSQVLAPGAAHSPSFAMTHVSPGSPAAPHSMPARAALPGVSSLGLRPLTVPRFAAAAPHPISDSAAPSLSAFGSRSASPSFASPSFASPSAHGPSHAWGNGLSGGEPLSGRRAGFVSHRETVPSGASRSSGTGGGGLPQSASAAFGLHPPLRRGVSGAQAYQGPRTPVLLPAPVLAMPTMRLASGGTLPASRLLTPSSPRLGVSAPRLGVSGGRSVSGSLAAPAPAMRFAPARAAHRSQAGAAAPPMTIQRALVSSSAAPARPQERPAAPHPAVADGAAKSDVNALAGEVWSLLKRRLANEAERRGRR